MSDIGLRLREIKSIKIIPTSLGIQESEIHFDIAHAYREDGEDYRKFNRRRQFKKQLRAQCFT